MTRAYIGLGTNLGDREGFLRAAVDALVAHDLAPTAVSSVYESAPLGPPQPDYLNAAAEVRTALGARELLEQLKAIEAELGRQHRERWGPREIDLDLLLYGDETIDEDGLTVPHPELTKRSFVLVPLLEIAPYLDLPSGEPLSAFCERNPEGLRKVGPL
ncbi:MAG TPA: 2-amino-4-hydroxy-6-hydroxymethyldihydropteridine diphosphokinase [Acidimicrobiales bacterium]|nr:2-amino-4-hydroxy-6-hydroxymethyldihydropteridine diphosphokinase [Acidimicrobiales bacterium]HLJ06928.1 2-amino-4-hydroxy-6-hydroxymethyldihydropteridine diphosphokinase [Acidimicrobiia bacterium]